MGDKDSEGFANLQNNILGGGVNVTGNTINHNYGSADTNRSLWNVPEDKNRYFTGREETLGQLRNGLNADGAVAVTQQKQKHVLYGMGGIGKTQLAIEYCHRCNEREDYPSYEHIWWINAESDPSIAQGLAALAEELGREAESDAKLAKIALQWLRQNENWLLVFDNAEEPKALKQFLPNSKHGHVLVTSRITKWESAFRALRLDTWSRDEAVKYLQARLDGVTDTPDAACNELADLLGDLPLSLAHAAAYIDNADVSLVEYIELYRERENRVDLNTDEDNQLHNYDKSVTAAIMLSVDYLADKQQTDALTLLNYCAFLSPDGIPKKLFTDAMPIVTKADTFWKMLKRLFTNRADKLSLEVSFSTAMRKPTEANKCWTALTNISLLDKQPGTNTYTMHRVVQEVIRDSLDDDAQQASFTHCVTLVRQAFVFKRSNDASTWPWLAQLSESARSICERAKQEQQRTKDLAMLCDRLASYYQNVLGQYEDAEERFRQAIDIDKITIGETHPSYASSLNNLAVLLESMGRYDEAEPLIRQAIDIGKITIGETHPNYAINLNNLAGLYFKTGRTEEAISLFERALAILSDTLGKAHPSTQTTAKNLEFLKRSQ